MSALSFPRHDGRSERQEGLPSHPPKRTNGVNTARTTAATTAATQIATRRTADCWHWHKHKEPKRDQRRAVYRAKRREPNKDQPNNLINFFGAP